MASCLSSQPASLVQAPCALTAGFLAAANPQAASWLREHLETAVRGRCCYTGRGHARAPPMQTPHAVDSVLVLNLCSRYPTSPSATLIAR